MSLNTLPSLSCSLDWLTYNPKDYNDIFPYAEAFEEIRRKVGQNFELRKIGSWVWGNVFEIQKNGKGIYVVKLPHSSWIGNENIEIFQKVKEEIDNQKQVIFRYENLLRQYDKALIKATTAPLQKDILDTLDPHFSNDETFWADDGSCFLEIEEKRRELSLLQIPKISEIYQGSVPLIVMEKIEWKSVWREVIELFFDPLFSSKLSYNSEKKCLESSNSLFWDSVSHLTDQELEKLLLMIFEQEDQNEVGWGSDSFLSEEYKDAWIWAKNLLFELKNKCKWNLTSALLSWLYRYDDEKKERLVTAYECFCSEIWEHPDPNLQNFIITPDNKLWIIDFW